MPTRPPPWPGPSSTRSATRPWSNSAGVVRPRGLAGRILAKLESLNPGGSKKDRVALEIVREARADGALRPGQAVVELTSGNTGTGLAIVCAALGHPFVAVMSRGNSVERARQMRALGAEVVLVDQAAGSIAGQVSGADLDRVERAGAADRRRAGRLPRRPVRVARRRPGPRAAHRPGALGAVGRADRRLRRPGRHRRLVHRGRPRPEAAEPELRAYVVEPAGAAVLAGRPRGRPAAPAPGGRLRPDADLPLFDRALVDRLRAGRPTRQAIEAARLLAAEEGIFAGFSTGAAPGRRLAAARRARVRGDRRLPRLRQRA